MLKMLSTKNLVMVLECSLVRGFTYMHYGWHFLYKREWRNNQLCNKAICVWLEKNLKAEIRKKNKTPEKKKHGPSSPTLAPNGLNYFGDILIVDKNDDFRSRRTK